MLLESQESREIWVRSVSPDLMVFKDVQADQEKEDHLDPQEHLAQKL